MNTKEKLEKLIELYEQDIKYATQGMYYSWPAHDDCEYECDQAKARKLEEVVADLKAIVSEL